MTKRIITTLAAIAVLIFIVLGVFNIQCPRSSGSAIAEGCARCGPGATHEYSADGDGADSQYSKSGFIPPPSDATGSSSPEAAAPKD